MSNIRHITQLPPDQQIGTLLKETDLKNQVMELRLQGKSFREIGEELGLTGNVAMLTFRAQLIQLSKLSMLENKEQRTFEVERIERMMDVVYPRALDGDLDAVKVALMLMTRKAKFLGLDAPIKMSHRVKAQVSRGEDVAELTRQSEELFMRLKKLNGVDSNKSLEEFGRELKESLKPIEGEVVRRDEVLARDLED